MNVRVTAIGRLGHVWLHVLVQRHVRHIGSGVPQMSRDVISDGGGSARAKANGSGVEARAMHNGTINGGTFATCAMTAIDAQKATKLLCR